jgi:hypothetical protein
VRDIDLVLDTIGGETLEKLATGHARGKVLIRLR